jgi:endonuclease YncB( thermonuclease family)
MRLAAAVIAVLLLACTSVAHAREVHIIDGDTLSVDNQSIRLFGMDAPEAGQSCRKPGGGLLALRAGGNQGHGTGSVRG